MTPTNAPQGAPQSGGGDWLDQIKNFVFGNAILQHLSQGTAMPGASQPPTVQGQDTSYIKKQIDDYQNNLNKNKAAKSAPATKALPQTILAMPAKKGK